MPTGGARNRSGPPKDPGSGRSERVGFKLTALPSEGYRGEVPPLEEFLPGPTDRHEVVWAQLWTTPQACAWSMESWRWPIIADLAKNMVRSEPADAPVNVGTLVRQLRDDCGLSRAGLIANGWAIAADEVASRRDEQAAPAAKSSSRSKLKVVSGGA